MLLFENVKYTDLLIHSFYLSRLMLFDKIRHDNFYYLHTPLCG